MTHDDEEDLIIFPKCDKKKNFIFVVFCRISVVTRYSRISRHFEWQHSRDPVETRNTTNPAGISCAKHVLYHVPGSSEVPGRDC